jgi:hypothetical protein
MPARTGRREAGTERREVARRIESSHGDGDATDVSCTGPSLIYPSLAVGERNIALVLTLGKDMASAFLLLARSYVQRENDGRDSELLSLFAGLRCFASLTPRLRYSVSPCLSPSETEATLEMSNSSRVLRAGESAVANRHRRPHGSVQLLWQILTI